MSEKRPGELLSSSSALPKHLLASPSSSDLSCQRRSDDEEDGFAGCVIAMADGLVAPVTDAGKDVDATPPSPTPSEGPTSVTRCCIRWTWGSHCLRCGRLTAPLVIFCLISVVVIALGRGYLNQLLEWLEHLPLTYSLGVFVILFTLISFPFGFGYIILNMTAGYLYGLLRGQVVVTLSVAVGFSIAFLLCRSCLRGWASNYMSTSPTLQAMTRVVEGPHGLKVILLTRLTPIPFGLQNTLFAMTDVTFTKALVGSVIGLFPTQVLNTYMGSTVRNMKEVLADRADGYIILTVQIIFSIILSLYLVHKAKQELSKLARPRDVETGLGDNR